LWLSRIFICIIGRNNSRPRVAEVEWWPPSIVTGGWGGAGIRIAATTPHECSSRGNMAIVYGICISTFTPWDMEGFSHEIRRANDYIVCPNQC